MNRYGAGLQIGNAIQAGLSTYGQLQGIDAREQEMGLRDVQAKMQQEQHDQQMRTGQQQEQINNLRMKQLNQADQQQATQLFVKRLHAIDQGGDASPEEIDQYMKLTGGGRLGDPRYIASKEVGDALAIYPRILKGEVDKNSPEAINAYNTLINVQRGATDGRKVSINRVLPSKDGQGVHFGLNVVNADGSVNPNGVLTDRRSAEPDDPVSEIGFDELNNAYGAISNLRQAVTNPKIRQALYREYGLGPQPISAKDQSAIDANNARADWYRSKTSAAKDGGPGGNGQTATIKDIEYFTKVLGYSEEDAVDMVTNKGASPTKDIIELAKAMVNESKDFDGKATMDWRSALESADQEYSARFRKKPQRKGGEPQSKEQPSAEEILSDLMGAKSLSKKVQIPMRAPIQAPATAIEALKNNPDKKDQFKAKYGYLPDGF